MEQKLLANHWEIISINTSEEWWDDEHWTIKSIKHPVNPEIVLVFKVDPQFAGVREKGQGIWEIDALTKFPDDWTDKTNSIATLNMTKRKFSIKLEEFITSLQDYRINMKLL